MVATTYDSGFSNTVWGGSTQTSIYGNPISKKEYDYGSGAPGTLLRTTNTIYQALNSSSYLTANLLTLPYFGAGDGRRRSPTCVYNLWL